MTRILIAVPSFRRPIELRKLLRSLEDQQRVDGYDISVHVGDNDPQRTEAVKVCALLQPHFRWALTAAPIATCGIAAVRNALLVRAAETQADYVAMVDDDEFATAGWLAELLATERATTAEVVGGPVLYAFEKPPSDEVQRSGAFPLKRRRTGEMEMLDATGNVLMSCDMLRRLGWPKFDDGFGLTGGEDKEFFTRLKQSGCRFAWADKAILHERVPEDRLRSSTILKRAYRIGNSDLRIAILHHASRTVLQECAKSLLVLLATPLLAPLLLARRWRLKLLRKWLRAAGKFAALLGMRYAGYANN